MIYRTGAWQKGADVPLRLIPEALYLVIWFCLVQSHCCLNLTFLSYQNTFFCPANIFVTYKEKPAYWHSTFLWPLGGVVAIHWGLEANCLFRKVNPYQERKILKKVILNFLKRGKVRYNSNIASTFLNWHTAMKLFFSSLKNSNSIRAF